MKEVSRISSSYKYLKLFDAIIEQIKGNELLMGARLPSVNSLCLSYKMSKETVLKGLTQLVEKGIIEAVYRKGYYVKKTEINHQFRVFLLLDKLTSFKEQLYQGFFERVKDYAEVDVFFHHQNYQTFQKLINENLNSYTHFVIVTFLKEDVSLIVNQIPPEKRILMDFLDKNIEGTLGAVYQDFEQDIYDSLVLANKKVKKYKRIVFVSPTTFQHHQDRITGFKRYCKDFNFEYIIIEKVNPKDVKQGDLYIIIEIYDIEDVILIKELKSRKLKLGKHVGLISFNDTPVKEILEGGISTITTDFKLMGETVADMLINRNLKLIHNRSKVIFRKSF